MACAPAGRRCEQRPSVAAAVEARRAGPAAGQFDAALLSMRAGPLRRPGLLGLEVRLDDALELDGERIALAVDRLADGDADPALAHAIFLDVGLLLAIELDADAALEQRLVVVRALGIGGQAVGERVGHGFPIASMRRRCRPSNWPAGPGSSRSGSGIQQRHRPPPAPRRRCWPSPAPACRRWRRAG